MTTLTDAALVSGRELSDRLDHLATGSGYRVLAMLDALRAGDIDLDTFRRAVAELVLDGNARAAELALAEWERTAVMLTGTPPPPPPAPLAPHSADASRLHAAVTTITADPAGAHVASRLYRLARAEAAEAAQTTRGDAMRATPGLGGWTRGLESDACELCTWWWREGRVWSKTHRMPRHKGCVCTQVPVFDREPHLTAPEQRELYRQLAQRNTEQLNPEPQGG